VGLLLFYLFGDKKKMYTPVVEQYNSHRAAVHFVSLFGLKTGFFEGPP
jgi:hypothetical protein